MRPRSITARAVLIELGIGVLVLGLATVAVWGFQFVPEFPLEPFLKVGH